MNPLPLCVSARKLPLREGWRLGITVLILAGLALAASPDLAHAQSAGSSCNIPQGNIGPFDYRSDRKMLPVVERRHFTPQVEALIRGESSSSLGGDLAYTLDKFPNHHRALLSLMRLAERQKVAQVRDMPGTVECYFLRALEFRADDAIVRMVYATFIGKDPSRRAEVEQHLDIVSKASPDDAVTQQYIGQIYFDIKDYPRALVHAHTAMRLGATRSDLREQLEKVGHWKDPAPEGASTAEAAPASPAASSAR